MRYKEKRWAFLKKDSGEGKTRVFIPNKGHNEYNTPKTGCELTYMTVLLVKNIMKYLIGTDLHHLHQGLKLRKQFLGKGGQI